MSSHPGGDTCTRSTLASCHPTGPQLLGQLHRAAVCVPTLQVGDQPRFLKVSLIRLGNPEHVNSSLFQKRAWGGGSRPLSPEILRTTNKERSSVEPQAKWMSSLRPAWGRTWLSVYLLLSGLSDGLRPHLPPCVSTATPAQVLGWYFTVTIPTPQPLSGLRACQRLIH